MAILSAGMVSAVLIASHALPGQNETREDTEAVSIAEQIATDISLATSITKPGANAIEFTVPDRGHGADGEETIRYEWSGVAGDPLLRRYNSGTAVTLCEQVQAFSLDYEIGAGELTGAPKILLYTDDPPSSAIDDKRRLMESWGFQVTEIAAVASVEELAAATLPVDVIYVSYELANDWLSLLSKMNEDSNVARGAVVEHGLTYSGFGIASFYQIFDSSGTSITITDNTHEITSSFSLGDLAIVNSSQPLVCATPSYAPDIVQLAERSGKLSLGVVEVNGKVLNGVARGRRVKLPWARSSFDIDALNDNGREILRRSIVWAAAPIIYKGVTIDLQISEDETSSAHREVQLLNQPQVIE